MARRGQGQRPCCGGGVSGLGAKGCGGRGLLGSGGGGVVRMGEAVVCGWAIGDRIGV